MDKEVKPTTAQREVLRLLFAGNDLRVTRMQGSFVFAQAGYRTVPFNLFANLQKRGWVIDSDGRCEVYRLSESGKQLKLWKVMPFVKTVGEKPNA